MSLEINLSPEQEADLKAVADQLGMTLAEYAETLVTQSLPSASTEAGKPVLTAEEKIRLLDQIAERHRLWPVLPPEAYDREWLYAEEDEELIPSKAKEQ